MIPLRHRKGPQIGSLTACIAKCFPKLLLLFSGEPISSNASRGVKIAGEGDERRAVLAFRCSERAVEASESHLVESHNDDAHSSTATTRKLAINSLRGFPNYSTLTRSSIQVRSLLWLSILLADEHGVKVGSLALARGSCSARPEPEQGALSILTATTVLAHDGSTQMEEAHDNAIDLIEAEHEVDDLADDMDEELFNEEGSLWRPRKRPIEDRTTMLQYPNSLPYECNTLEQVDAQLELIMSRLIECVRTRDFDVGFLHWTRWLEAIIGLRYPMKREVRAALARLYYSMATQPGLEARCIELSANICMTLLEPIKRIDIYDLQLPWRPLYDCLERELFPKARKTGASPFLITEVLLMLMKA